MYCNFKQEKETKKRKYIKEKKKKKNKVSSGKEMVYGFGGKNSIPFKAICNEMSKNGIKNVDLPGTKWQIKCIDMKKFRWDFTYLGKEELKQEKKKENGNSKEATLQKVKDALNHVKDANPGKILVGIGKGDLIDAVGFFSNLNEKQINSVWQQLITDGIIREQEDKVFFN